jgi:hypothetical protein
MTGLEDGHMDSERNDRTMSVREWARSRRIAASTAGAAARSGRISRDDRGRVVPEIADAEFAESDPARVDSPMPQPPHDSECEVDERLFEELRPRVTREKLDRVLAEGSLAEAIEGARSWALASALLDAAPSFVKAGSEEEVHRILSRVAKRAARENPRGPSAA